MLLLFACNKIRVSRVEAILEVELLRIFILQQVHFRPTWSGHCVFRLAEDKTQQLHTFKTFGVFIDINVNALHRLDA